MPGHFTHSCAARWTASLLPDPSTTTPGPARSALASVSGLRVPEDSGRVLQEGQRSTALVAVGPDLFFSCRDFPSVPPAAAWLRYDVRLPGPHVQRVQRMFVGLRTPAAATAVVSP